MTTDAPLAPPAARSVSRWPRFWRIVAAGLTWLGLAVIVSIYIYLQACIYPTVYTETDCDAYLILAKRMSALEPLAQVEPDPYLYQEHMWVENSRGEVTAKFAPGYPLVLAIFYRIGGDEAMILASPVMGGLAIIGLFLLARQWMDPVLALLAAATLAINPALHNYASYFLTHATMVCAVVWGMFFLWWWIRRPGVMMGLAAGLTLGFAGMVRHTGVLLAAAVAWAVVAAWLEARRERRIPAKLEDEHGRAWDSHGRAWAENNGAVRSLRLVPIAALLSAYAFMIALLALYNWRLFGSPWTTGYALSNEQSAFTFAQMLENLPKVYDGLHSDLTVFVFPLALVGMVAIGPWPQALLRLCWFLPIVLVYASYYWLPNNLSGHRFMLEVIPLLIAAAYLVIQRAAGNRTQRWLAGLVVLAMVATVDRPRINDMIEGKPHSDSRASLEAARLASDTLTDNAVIFAADPFGHYVATRRHFQLYDVNAFNRRWGQRRFTDPQHKWSPRMQPARRARLDKLYADHSDRDLRAARQAIIRESLAEGRQVAFLIRADRRVGQYQAELGPGWTLREMVKWDAKPGEAWGIYEVQAPAAAGR
ncbi:MAG: glycosyltransferase family 39 protein [Phycisphaeraceae bacterium]